MKYTELDSIADALAVALPFIEDTDKSAFKPGFVSNKAKQVKDALMLCERLMREIDEDANREMIGNDCEYDLGNIGNK